MTAGFGDFTVDFPRRQVTGATAEVRHLTPKAFDLLTLLIEQAPRVVTKTEIHDRLWPHAFVTDATLVGLIKELRKVLRDQDRSAPIIRTVHRIGYAFCRAEVALPDDPVVAEHWLSDGERRTVLHEGENMIGRDPAADIWLDLAGVSRKHARIVVRARHALIEDLGSKNGTTVGSERLMAPRALLDGDSILVGPGRITYRFSESGRSTETAPKHRLAQLLIPPAHTRSEE